MKLVFATNNQNKLKEISEIIGNKFEILNLKDINCTDEIPENQLTIEGNASQKSFYIYKKYNVNCFADDTGLEVEALNNAPGVFSARYAGENATYNDNVEKLLTELKGVENRKAKFKTVISLVIEGKEIQFEGIIKGKILTEKFGNSGFGYDPIFLPDGYQETFAEMSAEQKNEISHRGIAVKKLVEYLKSLY